MIGRLRQIRFRLFDAVVVAALAVLCLKIAALSAGQPGPKDFAGDVPSFARVIANARSNYVPPDVAMTGAVETKKVDDAPAGADPVAAPEGPKPQRIAFEPAPAAVSPAERALLERLGERRDEIQQKGREVDMRERLLENAERKLDSRINELKSLEEKTNQPAAKKTEAEAAGYKNLVTMYEAMKPKDAARVFDRLPHDVLVPVVLQMAPRKMAEVLAAMSPEAAEKLTVALAARARGAAPDMRASMSPQLPVNELPAIDQAATRPVR